MRFAILAAAVAACLGWSAAARAADELTLVKDGASDYVIVLDANASASEQFAAEELASHLKQMSGAELKIQKGGVLPAKAIILGLGQGASDALDSIASLKKRPVPAGDGFVFGPVAPGFWIAGRGSRGTLYGVYAFLESLGVRWWYLDDTFVPQKKTVTMPAADRRETPRMEYRDMMFGECFTDAGRLWMARNRVNGMAWEDPGEKLGGRYKVSGNLVHSYLTLLQSKDSGVQMKDEMYALRDGKRAVNQQPCLSNPDVLKGMVNAVVARLKADPTLQFVVVGQMDNGSYCTCPDCAAVDKEEDSHAGQVIRFANRVAEAVEKQVPGAKIATAAYAWSRKPPKNLKPRDNVYITLCSIECDFSHPLGAASNPENKTFKEDIEGWGKIAKKIIIWHYVGNRDHYLMPNPEWFTLQPNMKFFADNRCAGVFNQGTHVGTATDMVPLKMWVLAKSMWDTSRDSNQLIEEFCRGYYGPAADDVMKYLRIMARTAGERQYHLGRRVSLAAPFLTPAVLAEAEETLRAAEKKVADDPALARHVRHVHMGVWYVLAKRGPGSPTWQAVEKRVGKLDMKEIAASLAAVCKDYKMNKACDPDPLQPWLDWARQYGDLLARKGKVVPPELADADPATYRLIHACQLDMQPAWWKPTEGASDGWAAHVSAAGWHTKIGLSPTEDFTPGKTYRLFVRARGDLAAEAAGNVWEFGVHPNGKGLRVTKDQLADGKWHVFELGPWKPVEGQYWWTAMIRGAGLNTAVIDCLWLKEE